MITKYCFSVPSVFAKAEGATVSEENRIRLTHPLGHRIECSFAYTESAILFSSIVVEPSQKAPPAKQPHPEWYFHDHFVLFLDPKHDHMSQFLIAVGKDDTLVTEAKFSMPGEELSDTISGSIKKEFAVERSVKHTDRGWEALVRIPLTSLGLTSKPKVIGAKVKYGFEAPILYEAVSWPITTAESRDYPMYYGDVCLDENIVINALDFGTPYWKTGHVENTILLTGKIRTEAKSPLTIVVTNTNVLGEKEVQEIPVEISSGNISAKIPWRCHFANKWAPDFTKIARIQLDIRKDHDTIWSCQYPYGFDAGIIVRDPYGKFQNKVYTRPLPSQEDFVDQFRCWLFYKLPDWKFQTTREKAPSDFYLKDMTGRFDLNLMSDNVLEQIATYLKKEFDDWQDALCAASLLLHHPFLTRHSGSWNRISGVATTDSVLRIGGCFCGDTARVVAHLADLIGEKFGVPLKGFSLGLRGHLTGLVETPIGEVLLDPMLGIYYHTLDNKRLATLQEIQDDKRIHSRVWLLAYSNGHELLYQTYNQMKKPYQIGELSYPGYDR